MVIRGTFIIGASHRDSSEQALRDDLSAAIHQVVRDADVDDKLPLILQVYKSFWGTYDPVPLTRQPILHRDQLLVLKEG